MGLTFFNYVFTLLVLGLEVWAFVDVWQRPLGAFPAVSTWPKLAWLIIFGVGAVLSLSALPFMHHFIPVPAILFGFVNYFMRLAIFLLVIYYLTDIRSKLNSLS
jgi:hypothetical protein